MLIVLHDDAQVYYNEIYKIGFMFIDLLTGRIVESDCKGGITFSPPLNYLVFKYVNESSVRATHLTQRTFFVQPKTH